MRVVLTANGLLKGKNLEVLRAFHTAGRKRAQAAALLENVDVQSDWDTAKPYAAIPGPKPLPIPYVGNMWRLLPMFKTLEMDDLMKMHKSLYDTYGPIVRLTGLGRNDMVLLFDAEDVQKMFRNESQWPERMSLGSMKHYRTVLRKDFYGDMEGLVTSQGEKWQAFRSATNQPMMQPKMVLRYLDSMSAVVDDFIERVRYIRQPNQEMPDDFINDLNRLALESFGVVSLDVRLGCLEKDLAPDSEAMLMINNVKDILKLMFELEFKVSPWKYFSTPTWREFVRKTDEVLAVTSKHTYAKWEQLKKEKNEDGENRSLLEALLLKTKDPKIPIVMTTDTLFAGIDTTSNTTATILYFLATNPEKQEKLFRELKVLLPAKDSKITKEIYNELKYVKAAMKESMRLKPTAAANQRVAKKDLVLGGYQIPTGTFLIACHHVMCLMERHFKNPTQFVPERWLKPESDSEMSASKTNPFVFLPFGFGHRSCIGKRFAEMEMVLTLSKFIRNFEISYHHEPMTWTSKMLLAPAKPLRFRVTDRLE